MSLNKRLERLEKQAKYIVAVPVIFIKPGRDIIQVPGIGPATVIIVDDLED